MTRSVERLAAHVEAIKRNIDPSSVSRLMSLLRQVIEESETKHRYPILTLFCNWSLHPKLDQKAAQTILATIEEALREEMTMPGHVTASTLLATVSPRQLQEETISLLARNTIDPAIAKNPQYFVRIAEVLREDVLHKPLELTETKLREKLEKAASTCARTLVVRSLTIEPNADPQVKAPFVIKIEIRPHPPTPPTIYLQAPFVIATDAQGNPVA